ncbi:hypothetical protein PGB90_009561 [Kerria lacca]
MFFEEVIEKREVFQLASTLFILIYNGFSLVFSAIDFGLISFTVYNSPQFQVKETEKVNNVISALV